MSSGRQDEGTEGRPLVVQHPSIRPSVHPSVAVIAAVSLNGTIGRGGQLPWRLRGDLQRFKQITVGHPIIMGRKTWASIGRPLPGRLNIVVTRQPALAAAGAVVVHSLGDALAAAAPAAEAFVIGGAALYREALPLAARLYLTIVQAEVEGDTVFPPFDRTQWQLAQVEEFPADTANDWPCRMEIWNRVSV